MEPGVYFENINYFGKAITVKARLGSEATIIDRSGNGSVVTIAFGGDYAAVNGGMN